MVEKKILYIIFFLMFLLGIVSSLIFVKVGIFVFGLFLFVLIMLEDFLKFLWGVVFYVFVDFFFRKFFILSGFVFVWDEVLFLIIVFVLFLKLIIKN